MTVNRNLCQKLAEHESTFKFYLLILRWLRRLLAGRRGFARVCILRQLVSYHFECVGFVGGGSRRRRRFSARWIHCWSDCWSRSYHQKQPAEQRSRSSRVCDGNFSRPGWSRNGRRRSFAQQSLTLNCFFWVQCCDKLITIWLVTSKLFQSIYGFFFFRFIAF